MKNLKLEKSLVSVDWLYKNLDATNLVILNATIPKVSHINEGVSEAFQIPNTQFFDIKKKFSNVVDAFPNAFPSIQQFEKNAQELSINNNSVIVVYDEKGIYSSARAWYLFKTFGHKKVAVLNGGFLEWKQKEFPLEKKIIKKRETGDFKANLQSNNILFFEDILKLQKNKNYTILDARSSKRFQGNIPEPRKGLRSGIIPNSKNLPFENLLQNQKLLSKEALTKAFQQVTTKQENLVFSCGSGITACILALGADVLGYKNTAVYDGSWTEYGTLVEKN